MALSSLSDEAAFDLAQSLADMAMERCRTFLRQGVLAERKLDKTWVTQADLAIEREIRARLAKEAPGTRVLGEEEGGAPLSDGNDPVWILDPIDGTFSFVHGLPFYSSLLAFYRGRTPVLGIACLPEMGVKMSALRDKGAFVGKERYVRSRFVGAPEIEIVATADPYRFRMEGRDAVFRALYNEPFKSRTYPDALGYHLLLGGHVRAFVDPKVEIWDVAPFHVILAEAGFAIHSWEDESSGLVRGSSVAYARNAAGEPLGSADVLSVLRRESTV